MHWKRKGGKMNDEEIKIVDEWFASHTDNYGTYHTDGEYSLSQFDIEPFTDFLREKFPDMVGIRCFIGSGDSNIWFFRKDLEEVWFL